MKYPLYPRWPNAPRYWTHQARPPYRFSPQAHPHPSRHHEGHSFGKQMIEIQSLDPKIWFTNAAYRYGIDLYHEGYVWEAHEVWEGLWKHTDRHSPQRTLLQALILNTAAQLKIQEASVRGAQILSKKAYNHLLKLQGIRTFMGLDLEELLEAMHRCYAPLWNCTEYGAMPLLGPPPRLKLIFPAL